MLKLTQNSNDSGHGRSLPLLLGGDLKISDQNNWGDLSKKLYLGGVKFEGGPINPNDVMVVVLKYILLC